MTIYEYTQVIIGDYMQMTLLGPNQKHKYNLVDSYATQITIIIFER